MMRCLTVAEALLEAGHTPFFMGDVRDVPWLESALVKTGLPVIECERDALPPRDVVAGGFDRLVIDSYWIDADVVSSVNAHVPTLAIIDHTSRGIDARWYLDQNLGAEARDWSPLPRERLLLGSDYALVRKAITARRVSRGWEIPGRESRVLAFMGGTDPARIMTEVVASIAAELPDLALTAVTTSEQIEDVLSAANSMPNAEVMGPREDLPRLIGEAQVVVSAAGTSAWDVCSTGRPALLVGVVDNQSAGLAEALRRGIATGVDAVTDGAGNVGALLRELLDDPTQREALVRRANATFDGKGAQRVVSALTS